MSEPRSTTAEETVIAVVDELITALVNTRIYQADHPRVTNSIAAVQSALTALCEDFGEESLRLTMAEGLLVYKERPLIGPSLSASRILQIFETWQSGGVEISASASRDDIDSFLRAALARPGPGEDYEEVNRALAKVKCDTVQMLPEYQGESARADEADDPADDILVPVHLFQGIMDILQETTIRVCQGGQIDFAPVRMHAEEVLRRLDNSSGPIVSLASQDHYDSFTFGHSVRVAILSMNFARALTGDRKLLVHIGTAALLHDVGKSLVPFEILHSSQQLTPEERRVISKHTEYGANILLDHHDSDPLAVAVAFGHHCGCVEHGFIEPQAEPRKRGGYPATLHDHRPSLITELIKIADVYEALTAARPYKLPMSPTRAYRVMISMDGHFHLPLLRRFIEVNGMWPAGQVVELSTGECARVVQQGSGLMAPVVKIVMDRDGNLLDAEDAETVDLGLQSGDQLRTVLCAVEEDRVRAADAGTATD